MKKQKICVKQGHIWEKATLHLKSAITKFDHENVVKLVELDLLKSAVRRSAGSRNLDFEGRQVN